MASIGTGLAVSPGHRPSALSAQPGVRHAPGPWQLTEQSYWRPIAPSWSRSARKGLPWGPARHRGDALTAPRSGREPRWPAGARRPAVRRRCRGAANCHAVLPENRSSRDRWRALSWCSDSNGPAGPRADATDAVDSNSGDVSPRGIVHGGELDVGSDVDVS